MELSHASLWRGLKWTMSSEENCVLRSLCWALCGGQVLVLVLWPPLATSWPYYCVSSLVNQMCPIVKFIIEKDWFPISGHLFYSCVRERRGMSSTSWKNANHFNVIGGLDVTGTDSDGCTLSVSEVGSWGLLSKNLAGVISKYPMMVFTQSWHISLYMEC